MSDFTRHELEHMMKMARRDDWHRIFVGSEIRVLISMAMDKLEAQSPEALAKQFHETYERLAPEFGYATREDTKHFNPDSANGKLMIAVCAALSVGQQERTADEASNLWFGQQAPKGGEVETLENDIRGLWREYQRMNPSSVVTLPFAASNFLLKVMTE